MRSRYFPRFERPRRFWHDQNYNYIIAERIRVTPVGHWHWDDQIKRWCGWAHKWNTYSKTWSDPQWFVVSEFDTEGHKLSQL